MNNPTLTEFCFGMIGRADIEGRKEQEMARDVRGDYLDEMEDFKWSGDSVKSLADWLASVSWLGFTNRQVWGVSLIRGLEMLKDGVPKEQGIRKPNTSKPISLSTFW